MWTPPRDWTDGDKVTASRFGLIRDNFKFLYSPPHCRAAGTGTQQFASPLQVTMIDFQKTIFDNDGMRENIPVIETTQTEPVTGLIAIQTPGHYLIYTNVGFEWSATGSQVVVITFRATLGNAWTVIGRGSPCGVNSGGPRNIIPVLAALPTAAGYQLSVHSFANTEDAGKVVADFGLIPGFYVHWLGGT